METQGRESGFAERISFRMKTRNPGHLKWDCLLWERPGEWGVITPQTTYQQILSSQSLNVLPLSIVPSCELRLTTVARDLGFSKTDF